MKVGNLVEAFNDAVLDHVWTATGPTEYGDEQNPVRLGEKVTPA